MAENKEEREESNKEKPSVFEDTLDFFDVPHRITIVIGRTEMTIGDLLQLDIGSIVELTKSAGESFDVLANNKLIARGDVTVMEDRFGIRITELVEPSSRRRD